MEQPQKSSKEKNAAKAIISGVLVFSMAYAILRYHVFGPVPWKDLPFLILNKGFALSAFILIITNFTLGPLNNLNNAVPASWLKARRTLGLTGFLLVLIHMLISLMLFNPAVFDKFFEADDTLTLYANISMLAGILSFVVLWVYNLSFQTHLGKDKAFIRFITSRKFLLWALLLGMVHLVFMGFEGWVNPASWHWNMPPISLVAFSFFVIGYVINLFGRR